MSISPIQDFTNAIRELVGIAKKTDPADIPVRIDTTYLCPKDPNREKVLAATIEGTKYAMVLPKDAPKHESGWFVRPEVTSTKHRAFVDGKQMEFENTYTKNVWKCQTDGSEIPVERYS